MTGALLDLRGKVTRVGWELPADFSEDEWHAAGLMLGKVESGVSWWLGDWWAFGEHRYGDRKTMVAAEDWDGPAYQTCVNASNVSKRFESNRRRLNLSFKHHAEVAALQPEEQDRLLDRAEAEGLSVMKLRAVIRQDAAIGRTKMVEFNASAAFLNAGSATRGRSERS